MPAAGTKEQIYNAARALFSERGYAATTVRDIADAVGIRGASVYAHVDGKERILWELVLEAAEAFRSAVQPVFASMRRPDETLQHAIVEHVGVITRNIEGATVYFHEWRHLGPARRRAIRDRRDTYEQRFRAVIAEGMKKRLFIKRDPRHTSIVLLSSLNGVSTWYRPDGPLSPEALGALYADLLMQGLRKKITN
jgi:AcrR family transcriptional regulator